MRFQRVTQFLIFSVLSSVDATFIEVLKTLKPGDILRALLCLYQHPCSSDILSWVNFI